MGRISFPADNVLEFNPEKELVSYSDFVSADQNTIFTPAVTGTGAAVAQNSANDDFNHHGVLRFTSGSTAVGEASMYINQAITFGKGFTLRGNIYLTDISTSAQEYSLGMGIIQDVNAAPESFNDSIMLLYDRANLGVNWHGVTSDDGTPTNTDTSVAVVEDAWVEWMIKMNADYTSCGFYINGALVATNTTNFPDSNAAVGYFQTLFVKSVGTTARLVDIDYMYAKLSVVR